MLAREIEVTKSPIGIVIRVKREKDPPSNVLIEFDEWDWVRETVDNLNMGQTESRTFVL